MGGYKIKKGDTVEVIQGKEKGKRGKVLHVLTAEGRVVVERVNFIKRHVRPTQKNPQGGVIEREGSMDISTIKLVCPGCGKAARVGMRQEGDVKTRYCKLCNVQVDKG
ncbi:MAG: 50S ribosomal protein L24 [Actinobacteria bacterium]|nr:50S ribosomal protein L24 [Actinomycetota bacterium]OPZ77949.1 MAG: 50S ribosomal protein L24 [Actinobacteria bacterium ADurb.Bin444]